MSEASLANDRSQIDWYRNASSHIQPISRPYRPESTGGWTPWHRDAKNRIRQSTISAKPNAIMWFHIPLPEAYDDPDVDEAGREMDVGEVFDIGSGASKTNSHMLDNGILEQQALAEGEEGEGPEVKVLAHGHCHLTERCRRVKGVWYVLFASSLLKSVPCAYIRPQHASPSAGEISCSQAVYRGRYQVPSEWIGVFLAPPNSPFFPTSCLDCRKRGNIAAN